MEKFGGIPVDEPASPPAAKPAAPAAPKPDAADVPDENAERMARLERLARKSAAERASKAAKATTDTQSAEVAALRQKAELADRIARDPEAFLAEAERLGVSPERVAAFLRGAVESPEEHAARKAVGPVEAALQAKLDALQAKVDAFEQRTQEQEHSQAQARAEAQFLERLNAPDIAAASPLFAQWSKHVGEAATLEMANAIAANLPEGSTLDDVFYVAERQLKRFQIPNGSPSKVTSQPLARAAASAPKTRTVTTRDTSTQSEPKDLSELGEKEAFDVIARKLGL